MPTIERSEQLSDEGYYIFKGTVTNSKGDYVNNPIVICRLGELHLARGINGLLILFDITNESFVTRNIAAEGIHASLVAQAPFLPWGYSESVKVLPTKETTLGKIIPTKEVSGQNNLNVIEDELTDI